MARVLEGEELEEAKKWMSLAVEIAKGSPCKRDKRGVVIVQNGNEIGRGFNAPPKRFVCEARYCEPTCRYYTIHAEMNAIADAVNRGNWAKIPGAKMYHARAENGKLMDSRKPRCYDCSKHLVVFRLGEFVLKHDSGFTVYDIEEFNRLSLENSMKR